MSVTSEILEKIKKQDPHEFEFHQAAEEVLESLEPTAKKHPEFVKAKIYERIIEPDRVVMFRVPWLDDKGELQVNRDTAFSTTMPSVPTRAAHASTPRSTWESSSSSDSNRYSRTPSRRLPWGAPRAAAILTPRANRTPR
jgi:hypothetical protein